MSSILELFCLSLGNLWPRTLRYFSPWSRGKHSQDGSINLSRDLLKSRFKPCLPLTTKLSLSHFRCLAGWIRHAKFQEDRSRSKKKIKIWILRYDGNWLSTPHWPYTWKFMSAEWGEGGAILRLSVSNADSETDSAIRSPVFVLSLLKDGKYWVNAPIFRLKKPNFDTVV